MPIIPVQNIILPIFKKLSEVLDAFVLEPIKILLVPDVRPDHAQ